MSESSFSEEKDRSTGSSENGSEEGSGYFSEGDGEAQSSESEDEEYAPDRSGGDRTRQIQPENPPEQEAGPEFQDFVTGFGIPENANSAVNTKELVVLLQDIRRSLLHIECESDRPVTAIYAIEHLFMQGYTSMEALWRAFEKVHTEMHAFLGEMRVPYVVFTLFALLEKLETQGIMFGNDASMERIKQIVELFVKLPASFTNFGTYQKLLGTLRMTTFDNDAIQATIEEILSIAAPLGMILSVVSGVNAFIDAARNEKYYEPIVVYFPPYLNPVLDPYEGVSQYGKPGSVRDFKFTVDPDACANDEIINLIDEVESYGIGLRIDHTDRPRDEVANIEVPDISKVLYDLHDSVVQIEEMYPGRLEMNSVELRGVTTMPLPLYHIFAIEKKLRYIMREDGDTSDAVRNGMHCAFVLRRLHHLFRLLDGKQIIPYSTSVHLTYFRTFTVQITGSDILTHQPLVGVLDSDALIEISNRTVARVNPDMVKRRIALKQWITASALDLFRETMELDGDEFERGFEWLSFLVKTKAESDDPETIISEMQRLPDYPKYSEELRLFIEDDRHPEREMPQFVHIQLILDGDSCFSIKDQKLENMNQFKQKVYMEHYRYNLSALVRDEIVAVSSDFDIDSEEDCILYHQPDVKIVGVQKTLAELGCCMPPLNRDTAGIHDLFGNMCSGFLCKDEIILFMKEALRIRDKIPDHDRFVEVTSSLLRFCVFAKTHDIIVDAQSSPSDPPYSVVKCVNFCILMSSVADQLLWLNSTGMFPTAISKSVTTKAIQLRRHADLLNPMFPFEKYYIDGMTDLMASVLQFASPSTLSQSSVMVRGNRAVEYLRYLGAPCARVVAAYDAIISKVMQEVPQKLIYPFLTLSEAIQRMRIEDKDAHACCAEILSTIESAMMITLLRQKALVITESAPKNCVFPFSRKLHLGNDIVVNDLLTEMIPSYNFAFPLNTIPSSQQRAMMEFLSHMQDEYEALETPLSGFLEEKQKYEDLKAVADQLSKERASLIEDNAKIKEQIQHFQQKFAALEQSNKHHQVMMDVTKKRINDCLLDEERHTRKINAWDRVFDHLKSTVSGICAKGQIITEQRHRAMLRQNDHSPAIRNLQTRMMEAAALTTPPDADQSAPDDRVALPGSTAEHLRDWNVVTKRVYDEIREKTHEMEALAEKTLEARRETERLRQEAGETQMIKNAAERIKEIAAQLI